MEKCVLIKAVIYFCYLAVFVQSYNFYCPLKDKAISHSPRGDEKTVVLRVYQCTNATAHQCDAKPHNEVEIQKGVPDIVNFTLGNNYLLRAGYFGGMKNCYAWRQFIIKDTVIPPKTTDRQDCFTGCQDSFNTSYVNYKEFTRCDANNVCTVNMTGFKIDIIPKSGYNGDPTSCIVYGGHNFNVVASSVTINVTKCTQTNALVNRTCDHRTAQMFKIPVRNDTVTYLKNDVNGAQVLARFMGKTLCVALRHLDQDNDHSSKCQETCFDVTKKGAVTYVPYESDQDCSDGCVNFDRKSFQIQTAAWEKRSSDGVAIKSTASVLCFLIFAALKLSSV